MFDAGLRHQDDEFVSSVAGDDVRLAAFLFEQASDTCKNEVAFEVSERVVDLFELIQVHQHNGEWPPRPRSAFPFAGERLPEIAARFYSGKTVGDGLLLQLLEDERIVESSSKQVGERVEDEFVVGREAFSRKLSMFRTPSSVSP